VPEYGAVPPVALTVTVAEPPLQSIAVADDEATNAVGSVIVIVVEEVQPSASVTVYEYVPAVSVNDPVPEYGAVPPVADTVTVEFPPLQKIAVADDEATNAVGSVIVIVVEEVQPFASVTVYEYVPAVSVNDPVPEYGAVPPVALTVTVAEPPLQSIAVADDEATNAVGSVIVIVVVDVQPFASVTVYE